MSENDVIKKYEGPPATPDNFTKAFPEFEEAAAVQSVAAGKAAGAFGGTVIPAGWRERARALRPLDPASQRNLDELKRQMRSTPARPATVINLHPFALQFPATDLFMRGIVVPACQPGMEFAYHYIRNWSYEKKYTEDAEHFLFGAILPIHKATQFLISFGNPEVYGGGVIIYEGESHPAKTGMVETYYQNGTPQTVPQPGYEVDNEGNREEVVMPVPIKRPLVELLAEQTKYRNDFYMAQVQEADDNMKSGERARKRLVTDRQRLMAEVLHAQGILPALPEWNLPTRMQQGLSDDNCTQCGNPVKAGSYKCGTCARIIDPLKAYLDAAIEFGHVSFDRMSADQWVVAEEEKERRDKVREEAAARRKAASEAKPAKAKPAKAKEE